MPTCKIDGCIKERIYEGQGVCQMHYFRFMRNGQYDKLTLPPRQTRRTNLKGYVMLYQPGHPLRMKDGWVYEHRAIVYAEYGESLPPCELCGKATLWATCHIDHRDEVIDHNEMSNLRPVCRGCNTSRTIAKDVPLFDYEGELLTLTQLSKLAGVTVGRSQLKARMEKLGMTVHEALFSKNATRGKP